MFPFYVGDLEPIEVGSIIVAAMKRLASLGEGWAVEIRQIPVVNETENP